MTRLGLRAALALSCAALLAGCHARVAAPPRGATPLDTLVVTPAGAQLAVRLPADSTWRWHRADAEWPEYAWEVSWQPTDTLRPAPPRRESFGWFLERPAGAAPRTGALAAMLRAGYTATAEFYPSCGSITCWHIDRKAAVRVRVDADRLVLRLGPSAMLRGLLDVRPEFVEFGLFGNPGGAVERRVPVRYELPGSAGQ